VTEKATSVALLAKVPGYKPGQRVSRLIEQVDVFPSVAEAVGVPQVKRCPMIEAGGRDVQLCTEGSSFLVLMHKNNETEEEEDARKQQESLWKAMAFQQYPRPNSGYKYLGGDWPAWSHEEPHHTSEAAMGYAIRTDTWRYVEWVGFYATRG
jgi:arylsulfatase A-like enzyme